MVKTIFLYNTSSLGKGATGYLVKLQTTHFYPSWGIVSLRRKVVHDVMRQIVC